MSKKQTSFSIIDAKRKTEIIIYDMTVLVNKIRTKVEVQTLNGTYYGYNEVDAKIISSLNKEDEERFVEMLKKF